MNVNIGADMLRKSAGIIEERQKAYGPPAKNFANIAKLWTGWLTSRYGELASIDLDGTDVAVMNNLQKIARLAETPDHEDSWIDVAGYAACGLQVQKAEPVIGERTEPHIPAGAFVEHKMGCAMFEIPAFSRACDCGATQAYLDSLDSLSK